MNIELNTEVSESLKMTIKHKDELINTLTLSNDSYEKKYLELLEKYVTLSDKYMDLMELHGIVRRERR